MKNVKVTVECIINLCSVNDTGVAVIWRKMPRGSGQATTNRLFQLFRVHETCIELANATVQRYGMNFNVRVLERPGMYSGVCFRGNERAIPFSYFKKASKRYKI